MQQIPKAVRQSLFAWKADKDLMMTLGSYLSHHWPKVTCASSAHIAPRPVQKKNSGLWGERFAGRLREHSHAMSYTEIGHCRPQPQSNWLYGLNSAAIARPGLLQSVSTSRYSQPPEMQTCLEEHPWSGLHGL